MVKIRVEINLDKPPSRKRVIVMQKAAKIKMAMTKMAYLGNYLVMMFVTIALAVNGGEHAGKMVGDVVMIAIAATGNGVLQRFMVMLAMAIKEEDNMFKYENVGEKERVEWSRNPDAAKYLEMVCREERPLMKMEIIVLETICNKGYGT